MKLSIQFILIFLSSFVAASYAEPIVVNDVVDASNPSDIQLKHWNIFVGNQSINSDHASKKGIQSSAQVLSFGLEKQKHLWLIGGGFGTFFFKDESSFKVRVVDNYGNESTKSSSISTFSGYIEGGLSYQLMSAKVFADALTGFQYISAERQISNCTGCPKESLDFGGDLYLKPRLRLHAEGMLFSLVYQKSFSSKLDSNIGISVGWSI